MILAMQFLSTLPARGATGAGRWLSLAREISIHAPREGSDPVHIYALCTKITISIHAPREGSDEAARPSPASALPFLSTLPARGATAASGWNSAVMLISIHAPREGSDKSAAVLYACIRISIHAPREGSDAGVVGAAVGAVVFLSTLPARGATVRPPRACPSCNNFYPRSPRGERHLRPDPGAGGGNFYPRSPRGERRAVARVDCVAASFLSTLPARGATACLQYRPRQLHHFYPRSPRGERP